MDKTEFVYIEHWQLKISIDCQSHDWCTNHDEQKYLNYYNIIANEIEQNCDGIGVIQNQLPPGFSNNKLNRGTRFPKINDWRFPRIGAFEIFFRDQVIFSKLQKGVWPSGPGIIQRIKNIIGGFGNSENPMLPWLYQKQRRTATRRMRRSLTSQLLSETYGIEATPVKQWGAQKTKQRKVQKSVEPIRPLPKINDKEEERPKSQKPLDKGKFVEIGSQLFAIMMDITRTYRINVYHNKEKYMKIPYTNKTSENKVYQLTSSDPSIMQIVHAKVIILAGQREKFQVKFLPLQSQGEVKAYLIVKVNEAVIECIELIATTDKNLQVQNVDESQNLPVLGTFNSDNVFIPDPLYLQPNLRMFKHDSFSIPTPQHNQNKVKSFVEVGSQLFAMVLDVQQSLDFKVTRNQCTLVKVPYQNKSRSEQTLDVTTSNNQLITPVDKSFTVQANELKEIRIQINPVDFQGLHKAHVILKQEEIIIWCYEVNVYAQESQTLVKAKPNLQSSQSYNVSISGRRLPSLTKANSQSVSIQQSTGQSESQSPKNLSSLSKFIHAGKYVFAMMMDINRSFTIRLPINQVKFMKLPYYNKTDQQITYTLHTTNPELLEIKQKELTIDAKSRETINFKFKEIQNIGEHKAHLIVQTPEGAQDCIEFICKATPLQDVQNAMSETFQPKRDQLVTVNNEGVSIDEPDFNKAQQFVTMGDKLYAIMLQSSKKYDVKIPHRDIKFVRVPYINNMQHEVEFTLKSSDNTVMILKEDRTVIQPKSKGIFQVQFLSRNKIDEKSVNLIIMIGNKVTDCIQFNTVVIPNTQIQNAYEEQIISQKEPMKLTFTQNQAFSIKDVEQQAIEIQTEQLQLQNENYNISIDSPKTQKKLSILDNPLFMALGKQLIALHIDIQKNYKVKIILNDVKFMKVPYVNRTDRNQKYHLKSSDKDVMEVREDAVEILKNSRGILPVKFGPISAIGVRKVHLLIEKEAGETDCIEFEVQVVKNTNIQQQNTMNEEVRPIERQLSLYTEKRDFNIMPPYSNEADIQTVQNYETMKQSAVFILSPKIKEKEEIQIQTEDRFQLEQQNLEQLSIPTPQIGNTVPQQEVQEELPVQKDEIKEELKSTKSYKVRLQADKPKYMKISYPNKTAQDQIFSLSTPNPDLIEIQEDQVAIAANQKGNFRLLFQARPAGEQFQVYLIVKVDEEASDCIEFRAMVNQ